MSKEAMKLALEALEKIHRDPKGWWNCLAEITALREALAEQPAQQERMNNELAMREPSAIRDRLIQAGWTPPAQQEPVAWRELCRRLYVELFHCDQQMMATLDEEGDPMWQQGATVRDVLADAKAALDTSPPASNPCKVWDAEGYDALCQELEGWKAKAQRKPLTGQKIRALWEQEAKPERSTAHFFTAFARAIERAHGIKGDA